MKILLILLTLVNVSYAGQNVVVDWTYSGQADGFTIYWQPVVGGDINPHVLATNNITTNNGNDRQIAIPAQHFKPDSAYVFQMEAFLTSDGPGDPSNEYGYLHDLGCPEDYEPPDDNFGPSWPQECD